jgi:hypothetical protein
MQACYDLHTGLRQFRSYSEGKDFEDCKALAAACVKKPVTVQGIPSLAFTWGYCMTTVQAMLQASLPDGHDAVAMAELREKMTPLMEILKIYPADAEYQRQYREGGNAALKGTCYEGLVDYGPPLAENSVLDSRSSLVSPSTGTAASTGASGGSDNESSPAGEGSFGRKSNSVATRPISTSHVQSRHNL